MELTCSLLEKLLSVLSPNIIFEKYSNNIEHSLRHPHDIVKSSMLSNVNIVIVYNNFIFIYLLYLY